MIQKIYDYLYRLWYGYDNIRLSKEPVELYVPTESVEVRESLESSQEPLLQPSMFIVQNRHEKLSEGMGRAHSPIGYMPNDMGTLHGDSNFYWVYTVGKAPQERDLPFGHIKIPACPANKSYVEVCSIPCFVSLPRYFLEEDRLTNLPVKGLDIIRDIINPENLTKDLDLDAKIDGRFCISLGNDFAKRGVFYSKSNPPTKKEIEAAHKRTAAYYKFLLETAGVLARQLKPEHLLTQITPDHHAACEYFKVKTMWHPVLEGEELLQV